MSGIKKTDSLESAPSSDSSSSPPSSSDSSNSDSSTSSSSSGTSSGTSSTSSTSSSSSSSTSDESTTAAAKRDFIEGLANMFIPPQYFVDIDLRMSRFHELGRVAERASVKEWSTQLGCWVTRQTLVIIHPEAFAHGCMRASYHMIDLHCPHKNFVAKRYRKPTVPTSQYFDDVAMHSIAEYWATQFNACDVPKKVRFVPAAVLELSLRSPPLVFAIEPHLVGEFKKHNNNNGYVSEENRCTPQAFSHFTFHRSHGQLLIVDIQGVGDDYTDPQIMSLDGEGYGRGNLGRKGMEKFLKSHTCNGVCQHLQLPVIVKGRKTPTPKKEADASSPSPAQSTAVAFPSSGNARARRRSSGGATPGGVPPPADSPPQHLPSGCSPQTTVPRKKLSHFLRESLKSVSSVGSGGASIPRVAPPPRQPEFTAPVPEGSNTDAGAEDATLWGTLSYIEHSLRSAYDTISTEPSENPAEDYLRLLERHARRKAEKDSVLLDD